MSQDYEVVVIGGGPVGAMALAQLGHAGVRALGVEREPELWQQARAVHFDAEAMRSFQAMGRGAEIAALTKPMCDYRMENEAGETLIAQPTGSGDRSPGTGRICSTSPRSMRCCARRSTGSRVSNSAWAQP